MQLFRAHGLGNDYLVVEEGGPVDPALARALCHRHYGVGGDGLLEPASPGGADHGVTIWNPDGSIAEKSGNGLRIFAWWLHHERGAPASFTISTGPEQVRCDVRGDEVAIGIGPARFDAAAIPSREALIDQPLTVGAAVLAVVAVGVGNPHCVHFATTDLDALPWRDWGPIIERHPMFPNRTNVQFARVVGAARIQARIWERGAGETLASGTSACAVAAAAVRTGRVAPGWVEVAMPGGVLRVHVAPGDLDLILVGPVAPVARITVDTRWRVAFATEPETLDSAF